MKKECPHCRKTFVPNTINRYVKNMLLELMLSCPAAECRKKFKYEEMMDHCSKDCEHVQLSCTGCGLRLKRGPLKVHTDSCAMIKKHEETLNENVKAQVFPPNYPPGIDPNNIVLEKRELKTLENGSTYVGEWIKGSDVREGEGTEVLKDGSTYTGQFKEGYKTGKGHLKLASGYEYEGYLMNDAYHGHGKMKYPDGRVYVGNYMQGQCHGQGTLTYTNGQKYVGTFFDGQYEGKGEYVWPTGEKYEGMWMNSQRNGQGKNYYADGGIYEGMWRKNI